MIRPMAVTRPVTTKRTLAAAADSDDIDLSDDRSTSQSDESPSESDYSDFEDEHLRKVIALRASTPIRQNPQKLQTPSPSPNKLTPTRVQPSRAAKRKAEPPLLPLTPIQTPSPKRQKVTLNIKRPNPLPKAGHPGKEPAEETKGDYSLSKLDLDEFQPSYADRGELADRLDVASFMISVEKAVETAVSELVAARLGNGVLLYSLRGKVIKVFGQNGGGLAVSAKAFFWKWKARMMRRCLNQQVTQCRGKTGGHRHCRVLPLPLLSWGWSEGRRRV
ncbi:hypothetical protein NEUTE2DRAFT_145906 [Neurospora tetrasperma FGSC 2509]|nr:hypothetical protein NEUTE2DRAFT_145906 [Neurospora tetrasperma FGSC 2509]